MYSRDGSRSWRVLKREHCSSRRQQFSGQSSLPLGLVPFARLGLTPTSEREREGGGWGGGGTVVVCERVWKRAKSKDPSRSYGNSNWPSPKSSNLVILSIIDNPPSSRSFPAAAPAALRYSQVTCSKSPALRPNTRRIGSG